MPLVRTRYGTSTPASLYRNWFVSVNTARRALATVDTTCIASGSGSIGAPLHHRDGSRMHLVRQPRGSGRHTCQSGTPTEFACLTTLGVGLHSSVWTIGLGGARNSASLALQVVHLRATRWHRRCSRGVNSSRIQCRGPGPIVGDDLLVTVSEPAPASETSRTCGRRGPGGSSRRDGAARRSLWPSGRRCRVTDRLARARPRGTGHPQAP
jgi:hypothetical protein